MTRSRHHRSVLAAATVAWVTAAGPHARAADEDFCATMRGLINDARTDFSRIDRPSRERYRDSTLVLANAKECHVATDEFGGQYTCYWIVDSPAKGQVEFTALADGLTACFTEPPMTIQRDTDRFRATQRGIAAVSARWDRKSLEIRLTVQSDR
jgi:hypothetical protein